LRDPPIAQEPQAHTDSFGRFVLVESTVFGFDFKQFASTHYDLGTVDSIAAS
jgi:hypothetical protein